MPERPRPDPDRDPDPDDMPKIETPIIQSQDLEHQPAAVTRVNTKGVKVDPPGEPLPALELEDMEKEDAKARDAIAEFEEQYRKMPPG